MADDLKQTGRPDDARIAKRTIKARRQPMDDQDHELTYWSEKLGVPRDRLREAVAKVGSMRKAVEQQRRRGLG